MPVPSEKHIEFIRGWKSLAQGKVLPPRNFLAADVAVEYFRESGGYESHDAARNALDCKVWTPDEPGGSGEYLTDFMIFDGHTASFGIVRATRNGVEGYSLRKIPMLALIGIGRE